MKFKNGMILIGLFAELLFVGLLLANNCLAGFGISPPWVRNYTLLPGSRFEQTITLSRGDPKEDLTAKVTLGLPEEIKGWITIDKGLEFALPRGQNQVPMKVIVDVPKDAELGKYKGGIKVEAVPADQEKGVVSVALAAAIEIDLEVTEKEVEGMIVRYTTIEDVEEGLPIRFLIRIQNVGNVRTRPDRVYIEIFDQYHQELLASAEDVDMDWVAPFETKDIFAEFPIQLARGAYWAEFKIFKGENNLREGEIIFEVIEKKPSSVIPIAWGNEGTIYAGMGIVLLLILLMVIILLRKRGKQKKGFFPKKIKIGKVEIRVGGQEDVDVRKNEENNKESDVKKNDVKKNKEWIKGDY